MLLEIYYQKYDLDFGEVDHGVGRRPFDASVYELPEELRPPAVSFQSG